MNADNMRLWSRARLSVDSSWFVRPDDARKLAWSLRLLSEYRDAEPEADWVLETRGEVAGWHEYRP